MITAAGSDSLFGPYESCPDNPILTNAHDTSKEVQCAGHGDLFQDHRGNWWIVHLGIRLSRRTMSHLGRETFLTPVVWENGWPKVENNRKAALCCDGPIWEPQREALPWKADFTKQKWEPEWIFLRRPETASYERGNGVLRLHPSRTTFLDGKNPTFAAIRQRDFDCVMEAELSFSTECVGDEAGIAALLSSQFHYRFGKKRTEEGDVLVLEKCAEDFGRRHLAFLPPRDGSGFGWKRRRKATISFMLSETARLKKPAAPPPGFWPARWRDAALPGRSSACMPFQTGIRER